MRKCFLFFTFSVAKSVNSRGCVWIDARSAPRKVSPVEIRMPPSALQPSEVPGFASPLWFRAGPQVSSLVAHRRVELLFQE